jgi:predicted GIY-YIG superfamily endonuclease
VIDPRIRALAQDAAAKIKQISEGREREIEQIYKDFRTRADAISREASTKDLTRPGADSLPTTDQ